MISSHYTVCDINPLRHNQTSHHNITSLVIKIFLISERTPTVTIDTSDTDSDNVSLPEAYWDNAIAIAQGKSQSQEAAHTTASKSITDLVDYINTLPDGQLNIMTEPTGKPGNIADVNSDNINTEAPDNRETSTNARQARAPDTQESSQMEQEVEILEKSEDLPDNSLDPSKVKNTASGVTTGTVPTKPIIPPSKIKTEPGTSNTNINPHLTGGNDFDSATQGRKRNKDAASPTASGAKQANKRPKVTTNVRAFIAANIPTETRYNEITQDVKCGRKDPTDGTVYRVQITHIDQEGGVRGTEMYTNRPVEIPTGYILNDPIKDKVTKAERDRATKEKNAAKKAENAAAMKQLDDDQAKLQQHKDNAAKEVQRRNKEKKEAERQRAAAEKQKTEDDKAAAKAEKKRLNEEKKRLAEERRQLAAEQKKAEMEKKAAQAAATKQQTTVVYKSTNNNGRTFARPSQNNIRQVGPATQNGTVTNGNGKLQTHNNTNDVSSNNIKPSDKRNPVLKGRIVGQAVQAATHCTGHQQEHAQANGPNNTARDQIPSDLETDQNDFQYTDDDNYDEDDTDQYHEGDDDGYQPRHNHRSNYQLEAETRNLEVKLSLAREQTMAHFFQNQTDQNAAMMEVLKANSANLTEEQEEKQLNKPQNVVSFDNIIQEMTDDSNKNLTAARYLPAPVSLQYSQTLVPSDIKPIRTNYEFEQFGLDITRMAAVNKCHDRNETHAQLKSFADSNLKKVDTATQWKITVNKNIRTEQAESDLHSLDDTLLALWNYVVVNYRICPANAEVMQLYSACLRAKVYRYPPIIPKDICELFSCWLLQRHSNIATNGYTSFTWIEEKLRTIVNKRQALHGESLKRLAAAQDDVNNYSDHTTRPNRGKRIQKPINRGRSSGLRGRAGQGGRGGRGGRGGSGYQSTSNRATARGQPIPCRDYNKAEGCSREVSADGTCTYQGKLGPMILTHGCNFRDNGKYCMGPHPIQQHK